MAVNLQFKRGLLANLPKTVLDGTIYVTTDEHAMYVDNGNQRIRLGDFIPVNTLTDLPESGHAYETAVYYVKEGNILARWDSTNSRWIQINKAGVVGVTTATNSSPTGNVISEIRTVTAADGTLKLEITKATVATSEALSDLVTRVNSLESELYTDSTNTTSRLDVLEGDVNTNGSILKAIETARQALLNNETTYTTFKLIGDALRNVATQITNLQTNVGNLTTDVNANSAAIATLTGSGEGSVSKTVADAIAAIVASAPQDFDTLKEVSDWISSHGKDAATMNSKILALESNVSGLNTTVSGHTTDISGLNTRLTAVEGQITTIENDITTLNGNSTVVGSVDYKIANAIDPINTNINNLTTSVNNLESHLTWVDLDTI